MDAGLGNRVGVLMRQGEYCWSFVLRWDCDGAAAEDCSLAKSFSCSSICAHSDKRIGPCRAGALELYRGQRKTPTRRGFLHSPAIQWHRRGVRESQKNHGATTSPRSGMLDFHLSKIQRVTVGILRDRVIVAMGRAPAFLVGVRVRVCVLERVGDLLGALIGVLLGVVARVALAVRIGVADTVNVAMAVGVRVVKKPTQLASCVVLVLPSGQMAFVQVASLSTAPVKSASTNDAALRVAYDRFAPRKDARSKVPELSSAPARLVLVSVAPLRSDPLKYAPARVAPLRFTPTNVPAVRYALRRSRPLRLVPAAKDALGKNAVGPSR